jgi:sigma-B regulation protein RsbU (phosphoserine phosphatase)
MTKVRGAGWWEIAIPLGVLVVTVLMDALLPPTVVITIAFALAAFAAAALTTPGRTAAIAGAAVAAVAVSSTWNHDLASMQWWLRLVGATLFGATAVLLAALRERRERQLSHMTLVAETAQRALLRVLPGRVGDLGLAARYVSATEAALVGGDLYEVADTPFGVRVLVGDARGKGLDAVKLSSTVLAGFRRAALLEERLEDVARDLDRTVAAVSGDEDFVTALMAEFHDDGAASIVNCGHIPPLVVGDGDAHLVDTGEPALPLGLGGGHQEAAVSWPGGSRMLFYTDGLVEARDGHGEFFPLERYADELGKGDLDEALDALVARLAKFSPHHDDDLALVLTEHRTSDADG